MVLESDELSSAEQQRSNMSCSRRLRTSTKGFLAAKKNRNIRCGPRGQVSGPCWRLWWGLGVAKRNWSNSASSLRSGVSFEFFFVSSTTGFLASSSFH